MPRRKTGSPTRQPRQKQLHGSCRTSCDRMKCLADTASERRKTEIGGHAYARISRSATPSNWLSPFVRCCRTTVGASESSPHSFIICSTLTSSAFLRPQYSRRFQVSQQMHLFYCKSKNSVQKIKIFIIFFVVCCTSVALLVVKWKSVWRI